jgi:hypothetical protein
MVIKVGFDDRKAFENQIGWFEKHMRVCACESDTAKSEAVDVPISVSIAFGVTMSTHLASYGRISRDLRTF